MELPNEMKEYNFPLSDRTPRVKWRMFEVNSGTIDIATTRKYRPRTK